MSLSCRLVDDTLYVQEQGAWLGISNGCIEVRRAREVIQSFPSQWIRQILAFGRVSVTSGIIDHCAVNSIPVVFLTTNGGNRVRLHSAPIPSESLLRKQIKLSDSLDRRTKVAQAIVRGKLHNQRRLLQKKDIRRKSTYVSKQIEIMKQLAESVTDDTTLEALRGYEGRGAVAYFDAIFEFIPPEFQYNGRNKRPPRDPANALLSFGYALLFQNMESLILANGLHPSLGCYHERTERYSCLVADLIEEFRSPVVDALALRLLNQKVFSPGDFEIGTASPAGCRLSDEARRRFLAEFGKQMTRRREHPEARSPTTLAGCMLLQVRRFERVLREPTACYEPFAES